MKLNHVYCGESLSILKTFPSDSIDCIITSPPYYNVRDYKHIQQIGREKTPQEYISNLMNVFNECKRVLKQQGSLWVNISDSYKDKSLIGVPEMFVLAMQSEGWIRRNSIIWFKNNCMPSSVKDRFTIDFEYFYFFTKSRKYHFETQYEPLSPHTLKEIEKKYIGKGVKDYEGNGVQNPSNIKRRIVYKLAPFGGKNKHKEYGNRTYSGNEYKITSTDNLKRIKRCVWNINHQSFKGAHFACVDEETEILTLDGWKKYNEFEKYSDNTPKYILVATYSLKNKRIEYQKLSYIRTYNNCKELIKIGNRDLDILVTPNHRNIVLKKTGEEKIAETTELAYSDKILVNAPIIYPQNNGIGKTFAELVGWIISEGCYKKGGYIEIYQNEGIKSNRISSLLNKLEIPHTKTKRIRDGKQRITFYLKKSPLVEWCYVNIPDKKLNKFLISLPQQEIECLFSGLIAGDGHIRLDDGRISFIQKDKKTKDWFQILALRLGYHSIQDSGRTIFLTKRTHIGIRNTNGRGKNVQKISYNGIIWCPKTPNGTWIARRNGKIFITGNTFPEKLIETPIKACCPEDGIILDCFAGSGTTALVSKKLKRNYIMIDINEQYCKMMEDRLSIC